MQRFTVIKYFRVTNVSFPSCDSFASEQAHLFGYREAAKPHSSEPARDHRLVVLWPPLWPAIREGCFFSCFRLSIFFIVMGARETFLLMLRFLIFSFN